MGAFCENGLAMNAESIIAQALTAGGAGTVGVSRDCLRRAAGSLRGEVDALLATFIRVPFIVDDRVNARRGGCDVGGPIEPGAVISGRFVLEELIGQGCAWGKCGGPGRRNRCNGSRRQTDSRRAGFPPASSADSNRNARPWR